MTSYKKNSFLDDIEIKETSHNEVANALSKIAKKQSARTTKKSFANMSLQQKLEYIEKSVYSILGRYRGFVKTIRSKEELEKYIDKAIRIDYLCLDTETNNSLDPLTCKLMGICTYMPNTKPVYVPINHTVPGTDKLLENQLTEKDVRECVEKLNKNNTKIVYHNGKFDLRVIYNTTGIYPNIWWDTMIGSQLLNENDQAKLKVQYPKHVDPTVDRYDIEGIFMGLPYAWIDPEIFALYAAIDAYDTHKLRRYQQKEFEKEGMNRLFNLFMNVEMPVVKVTARMEDCGVCIDLDYLKKLNAKYEKERQKALDKIQDILTPYSQEIVKYQALGKLDNPYNINSDSQLNLIIYDILKIPRVEGMKKSTEKQVLEAMDHEFAEVMLEYKHYNTLITNFTSQFESWLSEKDGKLHAHFNQMGTEDKGIRTGRFSSTQPNLQQVPSHEKTLRLAFKASEEYENVMSEDNYFIFKDYVDAETINGYKKVKDLVVGDILVISDNNEQKKANVISTKRNENKIKVVFEEIKC